LTFFCPLSLWERVRVRGKPNKNGMHALTLALSQRKKGTTSGRESAVPDS